MEFSVGDKVVHPHHGPGRIAGVERREFLDGAKRYYVIEIPTKDLTVYVPWRKVDQAGVRRYRPGADHLEAACRVDGRSDGTGFIAWHWVDVLV